MKYVLIMVVGISLILGLNSAIDTSYEEGYQAGQRDMLVGSGNTSGGVNFVK